MSSRRLAFCLAAIALSWLASPAEARDKLYPKGSIADLAEPGGSGRLGPASTRGVPVTLTGNRRPVDEARRAELQAWFAKDPRGPDMASFLDTELEVEDQGRRAWVPAGAASEATQRGKAGDGVTLVVETIAGASGKRFAIAPRIEWGRIDRILEIPGEAEAPAEVLRLRYARGLLAQVRRCAEAKRGASGFPASLDEAKPSPARCVPPGLLQRPVFGYRFLYAGGPPGADGVARLFLACAVPGTPGRQSAAIAGDEEGSLPPLGLGTTGRDADCMAPWSHGGGGFALRAVKNCLVLRAAAERAKGGANAFPRDLSALAGAGCEAPDFVVRGPDEIDVRGQILRYTPKSSGTPERLSGFSLDGEDQYATGRFLHLDERGFVRVAHGRPAGPGDKTLDEEIAQENADAERAKRELPADRARCEAGILDACNVAAHKAWIARDGAASMPLWERACAGGDREGCVMAKSRPYGIRQFNRVLEMRTACFRGEAAACAKVADAVALAKLPAKPGD